MLENDDEPTKDKQPNERIRVARERCGKTPKEVAALSNIDLPTYYDLETFTDEVTTAVSLRDLNQICGVLGISIANLFDQGPLSYEETPNLLQIHHLIERHLLETGISVAQFEHKVGYTVKAIFQHPETIWDWNIDCLSCVCCELGIDWRSVLPK